MINGSQGTYDYWTLRGERLFLLLRSLFEDERTTNTIFFDTQINWVTEALLYCKRLYTAERNSSS